MIDNNDIIKNIVDKLKQEDISLSIREIDQLMECTINTIDQKLYNTGSVEIDDFGKFIRRQTASSSAFTNFKPCDRFSERIKQKDNG